MSLELERYRKDRHPRPGRSRAIRILFGLGVTAGLLLGAYLGVKWLAAEVSDVIAGPEGTTVVAGTPVTFEVAPGAPASQIARDLAAAGVVPSASAFDRVVREERASDRLQAGTYELETGMEPEAVLAILIEGPPSEVYLLTIVEGLTVGRMLESVSFQTSIPFEELTTPLLDGTITSGLLPEEPDSLQDWEGLLFPDTYEFHVDATATDIVGLMAATAEDRVGEIDWTFLVERGMTPYQGIVIASLIEREAALDEDRPFVASVIFNRLDLEMRLQFDATVVYALGGLPEGGLSLEDLEIDSPYNTYRHAGLPPTPISGAGLASLVAAAQPAESDYLYFLTKDDSGKFSFTADYDEFLQWQQEAVANS
ncbi:MAG TPA: endolytic transglycosylase MltG [Acidimicrobiia bacterium]|nr:endolytic transglycosylase MltG [Acidimicrobiia bacterium]